MTDLPYLSAAAALRLFRSHDLSPVELMTAMIDRAEKIEPAVNAFAERRYEEALTGARRAESRYAGRSQSPRALEGVPVATKEEQPIAGRSWREGSRAYADRVAEVSHPVVERVLAAGGIIHARTTAPEFSCAAFTHSTLWGVTRNPWNVDYSPGGSSGGSGAALAAGTTTLATGSDIGGSIRIPASFTGTVGYKPPYGRVAALPPFNLDHYCHDGPMARSVDDCRLLENVLAGPHPADVVSLPPSLDIAEPDTCSGAGLRVALSITLGDWPVDPQVEANTRAVADALREAGAVVEEVDIPWTRKQINTAVWAHFGAIFGPMVAEMQKSYADIMTPYAQAFAAKAALAARHTSFLDGLQLEGKIFGELGRLLTRYDALLCPTTAIPAYPAGEDYTHTTPVINGTPLEHYLDACMTSPFNIASRCPVLALPSGHAHNGVPTGVQVVGRTYDDATVFRIGSLIERARPFAYTPDHQPPL